MLSTRFLFFSLLVAAPLAFGQGECTSASLKGAYAYAGDGTITANGKAFTNSRVGRMVFDGAGQLTGYEASTNAGDTKVYSYDGTISIGADCTATGVFNLPDGAKASFDLVVTGGGASFVYVVRDPAQVLAGTGNVISSATAKLPQLSTAALTACSAETLKGAFGYAADGVITFNNLTLSVAEVGLSSYDGAGGIKGVYSLVTPLGSERMEFTGTYTVAEDCTGNAQIKVRGETLNQNFVVNSDGLGIFYSETGGGITMTGVSARTFGN